MRREAARGGPRFNGIRMDDAFKQAMGAYDAGRYAEARQRFQQLVNAYPHHSELWLNLGNVEYRLNELTLAENTGSAAWR